MNNRDYKEFAKGEIYHIYNRGVDKMDIFRDEEDFKVFLFRLKENLFPESIKDNKSKFSYRRKLLPANSFDLITYCLMPNHFHLLIKQNSGVSISGLMLKLCGGYSKYFNKKYGRVGSLFQDQFKAVCIQKNKQLLWTSLYIHENPIKAELVNNLLNYKWSSFSEYNNDRNFGLCKKNIILNQYNSPETYLSDIKKFSCNKTGNKVIEYLNLLIDYR